MTIDITLPNTGQNLRPLITVMGVGGSGGNAVNNMMRSNLEGVNFLIANTDAQALDISKCERRIQLGVQSTKGLGAGMRPDIGREAAEEAIDEINEKLEGSHMIFIAAGMGGGTGTGASPVIAKLAREKGILTVGVVTKPFHFEGTQRMKLADKGIEELQQYVDTLLVIPNQNLFRIANEKTTFSDAFKMADDVLYAGVRGVTDLMVQPGLINLDFSDVKTVMSEMGKAMMGTGEASGDNRAIEAAEAAIANPLIDDVTLKGARGLIINITGGNDITLYEVDEAANRIKQEVEESANIIYGTTCDDRLEGKIRVSIVATGIDAGIIRSTNPAENLNYQSKLTMDNSVYENKSDISENKFNNDNISISDKDENLENLSVQESEININNIDEIQEDSIPEQSDSDLLNKIDQDEEKIMIEKNDIEINDNEKYQNDHSNSNHNIEFNEDKENEDKETEETPKSTVRRLSLFDTLEENPSEQNLSNVSSENESMKIEPTLEENQDEQELSEELNQDEFSPESNSEEEINQDSEEEILDIPTFLRRQAN